MTVPGPRENASGLSHLIMSNTADFTGRAGLVEQASIHGAVERPADTADNQVLCEWVSLFRGKLLGGFPHFGTAARAKTYVGLHAKPYVEWG